MKQKVYTLRFDDETGAFDDRELRAFVEDEYPFRDWLARK